MTANSDQLHLCLQFVQLITHFQTTGVNKYRKKSMATCHYIIAWEKQLFSAQLTEDVKQYYQSDKAMHMWTVRILSTHIHIYTRGIGNQCKWTSDRTNSIYTLYNKKSRQEFFFCCHTHIGTAVHLTSYPKCTSGSFPGNKASGVGNKPLTLI